MVFCGFGGDVLVFIIGVSGVGFELIFFCFFIGELRVEDCFCVEVYFLINLFWYLLMVVVGDGRLVGSIVV